MTVHTILKIKQITIPVAYIVTFLGSVSWLTTTYNTVEQNRQELIDVERKIETIKEDSNVTKQTIIKIDGKIDTALKLLEIQRGGR